MFSKYKNHIEKSLENAEKRESKLPMELLNMYGMTGKLTRHFYNNLLNIDDARYLEIGTWTGSSLCSAIYGNKTNTICIDNWSGGDNETKRQFLENLEKYKGENEVNFIENDCFKVDVSKLPKFNIYLYDGDHKREDHEKALLHYYDCLDDIFILIVDDWNWNYVRDGTYDAMKKLNLKVLYNKEYLLTNDNSHTPYQEAVDTWWNGIYIAILQKDEEKNNVVNISL